MIRRTRSTKEWLSTSFGRYICIWKTFYPFHIKNSGRISLESRIGNFIFSRKNLKEINLLVIHCVINKKDFDDRFDNGPGILMFVIATWNLSGSNFVTTLPTFKCIIKANAVYISFLITWVFIHLENEMAPIFLLTLYSCVAILYWKRKAKRFQTTLLFYDHMILKWYQNVIWMEMRCHNAKMITKSNTNFGT